MAYTVPRYRFDEISAMTDDELFDSMKKLKRISLMPLTTDFTLTQRKPMRTLLCARKAKAS